MKNVKLLICYHKPDVLLQDEYMTPIHVGRAMAKKNKSPDDPNLKWLLENMIGDDTGENISLKNGSYNELTSLYWAWKNYDKIGDPEYIGLMHYRRHFVLREGEVKVFNIDKIDENYFKELNYSPQKLSDMLEDCDFICHLGKVDNIYKHYLDNHRPEDIELALSFLSSKYQNLAKEYMNQSYGNFCNMFIFPKKIFFDYCEWLFDILERFENTVDTSEKRLFISERLTGIYIYGLMKENYKYKVLPISFVAEPINIPVAMPLDTNNLFTTATTITSMLKNAAKGTSYTYYLMSNDDVSDDVKAQFESLKAISDKCTFEYIKTDVERQYYPLVISELVKVNKCLYMTETNIVFHDLAEFFRTCSVDDYYAVGLPAGEFDTSTQEKVIKADSLIMLHCGKFRKHKIYDKALEDIRAGKGINEIVNKVCYHQLGYFPYWFVTSSDAFGNRVFPTKEKARSEYQAEALWRPILYYGEIKPWLDIFSTYSNFWWDFAKNVPCNFKFNMPDINSINHIADIQQNEINNVMSSAEKVQEVPYQEPVHTNEPEEVSYKGPETAHQDTEVFVPEVNDHQNDSMVKKAKVFYKQYGFRKTVKRFFQKIFVGGEYVDK